MEHEPWLEKWSYEDDKVILEYEDGATLRVTREDFIRAFGVIIGLTKAEAERIKRIVLDEIKLTVSDLKNAA